MSLPKTEDVEHRVFERRLFDNAMKSTTGAYSLEMLVYHSV